MRKKDRVTEAGQVMKKLMQAKLEKCLMHWWTHMIDKKGQDASVALVVKSIRGTTTQRCITKWYADTKEQKQRAVMAKKVLLLSVYATSRETICSELQLKETNRLRLCLQ